MPLKDDNDVLNNGDQTPRVDAIHGASDETLAVDLIDDGAKDTDSVEVDLKHDVTRHNVAGEDAAMEEDPEMRRIWGLIDSVVPRTDDPTLPSLTFRVWFLGLLFTILMSAVNTLFTFRTNSFSLNPFIGSLLAYPMGIGLARILPTTRFTLPGPFKSLSFTLNPGPFNFKEHALIFVFASTASGPAYALYNIIGQKYQLYQDGLSAISCVAFGVITQIMGFGLAGICRRYLVRPLTMLWPYTLSTIAMLNSLHHVNHDDDVGVATAGMAAYQFLPGFIAPILTAVSLLCYIAPRTSNPQLTRMLGSAQSGGGLGMFSLTFDWSIISNGAPITTPLWALLNQYLGIWFFLWVLTPILWAKEVFGSDQDIGASPVDGANGTGRFPLGQVLNSPSLFDKTGKRVSALSFLNRTDLSLRQDVYDTLKPIRITTYFAVEYTTSFIVFASAIVHVAIWYGKDIYKRFRTAVRDLDRNDIHAQLMDAYPDVPDLWYLILLAVNVVAAIFVCQFGGFDLPWWGVLLGLALACISMLPIGIISGISGQTIGLNVMSEFLIGLILPGRIIAVMSFKTLSYMAMNQGLLLVQDLKFAWYLKINPRHVFIVQLVSTILAVIINIFASFFIYESFGRSRDELIDPNDPSRGHVWMLQGSSPPSGWNANNFAVFLSAGAIWGAIGPARFFGLGSPYNLTLVGFAVGLVAPLIPYTLHRIFPRAHWDLVNIPLIAVFSVQAGGLRSDLVTPLIIGVIVNYYIKRHHHAWWEKYAYVMSAAFDSGSAIGLTIIFAITSLKADYQIVMPQYIFNRYDAEVCAPDFYLTCKDHEKWGNAFGGTYNISEDAYCNAIDFGGEAA